MSHDPIRVELVGNREAQYDGHTVRVPESKGVMPYMARDALQRGYSGTQMVHVFRGDTLCFVPMTLQKWAELQIYENDKGIQTTQYTPMPKNIHS